MITMKELMGRPMAIPAEHSSNLQKLFISVNKLRTAYGKPMKVTSGYRSLAHHLEIYKAKGITDQSKIPMQSNHLKGLAVDLVPVEDPIGHLHDWVNQNVSLMEDMGFYMEAFEYTPTWTHFQIVAPKSGNRFFIP